MELNKEQIEFLNECTEGEWTFNEKTGLVDIEGDFNFSYLNLTDFKGVRFGVVTGKFNCECNKLTSLEGSPRVVNGGFYCGDNRLTSLVGAPQKVRGYFSCGDNKLTSLEGAPQEAGGGFWCGDNKLTSLVGAPREVPGCFWCANNRLTSLVGAPQKVVSFCCDNNKLTSLEGAPQEVSESFFCKGNPISEKTLKLVWKTMKEKKVDYWFALSILKSHIESEDWEMMSIGLDANLSKDSQKGISMLGRFGHFD